MESDYVTLTVASQITGFDVAAILRWCKQNEVRYVSRGSDHQHRLKPSLQSLFSHIHEVATATAIPRKTVFKARKLDRDIDRCMNKDQLAAHRFLMDHPDKIECRRGGRMLLSTCQRYVKRHYGLSRTIACFGCSHYQPPSDVPRGEDPHEGFSFVVPSQLDDHARMRDFEREAPELHTEKEPKKPKLMRGEAAKLKSAARMDATKARLQASFDAKHAARVAKKREADKNRDANIAKAKKMKARGKSFREIGLHFGVCKTTAERWITGHDWR